MASPLAQLQQALADCMPADARGLARRLQGLRRREKQRKPIDQGLKALTVAIEASVARRAARRAALPVPDYPLDLPVVEQRAVIRAAIENNQVVIVCGETGSGKTTQLPKICLELGRGEAGFIGHTQPRRIAARSLAARIAEELHSEPGGVVGFKVRFHDHTRAESVLKVMTDGILLAETQGDPDLLAYDTLIIDEAHERSLNIDFLLGYIKNLLPRRPDMKVIITSATIDPQRFSKHFNDAPIVEVSGRTYPVEMRYRPLTSEDEEQQDRDRGQAILDAVDELARVGPGDVLVFLPGEREIRDTAEKLRKHHPPGTEILPLFARLSAAQQAQVFKPHKGRRIVLSTNVAETSLTVPGIRYVVDTGLARMSRYSYRTKVQRLPVEKISQAAANQRAGRCGRVAAGVCIRLYGEDDFAQRPAFTEPEILRTNLAAVILQMLSLKLGDVEDFPFVEPPDERFIRDGFKLLHELGAVDEAHRLTPLGRELARLPIDPRIGRMVLAARDEHCLEEVLIIAAALSVPDARERPLDRQQAADEKHKPFADETSDFLSYLNLWRFYHAQARHLSQNKLRKLCLTNFLSYVRLREWHDIQRQLQTLAREMGLKVNSEPAPEDNIHRALLTGLLGNVAFKSEAHEYSGARGNKLHIHPGSSVFKKAPKWIMAGELVETGKLYARTVAGIEPAWIEGLAGHLTKRSYSEPHWEKKPAQVAAYEKVSLYGLVIVPRRRVNYGPIDPKLSRELFIRGALVEGEYHSRAAFFSHNRALLAEVEELEAKARRRDVLVDDALLYQFYDERIPDNIYSGAAFEKWCKSFEKDNPEALRLTRDYLMQHGADAVTEERFPDTLEVAGLRLPLSYHFAPGHGADGVTVTLPLAALNALTPARFEWLVPGLLQEKITALIKSLPKSLRRNFVPAPDYAQACVAALAPGDTPLREAVAAQLEKITGISIPANAWRPELLPVHLFMSFRVVDEQGKTLAQERDLAQLQDELGEAAGSSFHAMPSSEWDRDAVTEWDFGELPEHVDVEQGGMRLRGYPALVKEGEGVALRLLDAEGKAKSEHREGLLALYRLQAGKSIRLMAKNLPKIKTLCLHYSAVGKCDELKDDLVEAALARSFFGEETDIRRQRLFEERSAITRQTLVSESNDICRWAGEALAEYHQLARYLKGSMPPQWLAAAGEARAHLDTLIYRGFVTATPHAWLRHLGRFIKAIRLRLEKLEQNPARDRKEAAVIAAWQEKVQARADALKKQGRTDPELEQFRWLLEEYRVSVFAQELKTSVPISAKRLEKAWESLKA